MRSAWFAITLAVLVASPAVVHAADTVGDILSQMKTKQKEIDDLEGKMKDNLAKKNENIAKADALATEFTNVVKPLETQERAAQDAADAALDRAHQDYAGYQSQCPEGFPEDQQAACEARYQQYSAVFDVYSQQKDAAKAAYQTYSDAFDKVDAGRKEVEQAETDRAAEATKLIADSEAADHAMKFLEARLRMAKIDKKSSDCLGLDTNEAVVNCLSGQWDGTAKLNYTVPDPPTGLTQEQVIERYKNSGKPTGPQSLKIKEPPPPPPSSK